MSEPLRVGSDYWPVWACTYAGSRPIGPAALDCVRVIVIRSGSALLVGELGQRLVKTGDVVLLAANVLCGSEPECHITLTTIHADTDYVIDQVYWQHAGLVRDRLDAQDFAATIYAEPAQVLSLGERQAEALTTWLDEMVALSAERPVARYFFRMQALWFSIAHVIAPFIKASPVRISAARPSHVRPTLPRERRFAPIREEARRVAELLRTSPERRWTLAALAMEVHLSPAQLGRVFVDAFGKTPLAFLTMVRAERLARYLRETDLTVTEAMWRVGWRSRSHGTELFRQYVGLTPGAYRRRQGSCGRN